MKIICELKDCNKKAKFYISGFDKHKNFIVKFCCQEHLKYMVNQLVDIEIIINLEFLKIIM